MTSRQCKTIMTAAVLLAAQAALCAHADAPRLHMTLAATQTGEPLDLIAGEPARLTTGSQLKLRLDITASARDSGAAERIATARVFLKAAGAATAVTVAAPAGNGDWSAATVDIDLSVDPLGPIAQSAAAVCASVRPAGEDRLATLPLPVVWRFTTGRFAFARIAASGLTLTDDMLHNLDFYSETRNEDVEASVPVAIRCPKAGLVASTPTARSATPDPPPPPTAAQKQAQRDVSAQQSREGATLAPAAASTRASVADTPQQTASSTFSCEGGMVRETFEGTEARLVCLCPGHTHRRQTAQDAFVCERRFARNR